MTTTIPQLTAAQLITYWASKPSALAAAMPAPAAEFVTVAVKRIVRSSKGEPYRLIDKGELVLPKVTATLRPTKFAPKWKTVNAAEAVEGFFEGIGSPVFLDCPDDIVWQKAIEFLNLVGGPVDTLAFSRAINRALLARAGAGDVHPKDIP